MSTSTNTAIGSISRAIAVNRRRQIGIGMLVVVIAGIVGPCVAIDLESLGGITGPLAPALTTLSTLTPGLKAIVAFVTFCVAFISLSALRNFAPVLFFMGVMVFGAVGLVIGGAILGAVI